MPLTQSQINEVITWMNTWEQLRGTVIPIRFKEDFVRSALLQFGLVPEKFENSVVTQCGKYSFAEKHEPDDVYQDDRGKTSGFQTVQ